MNTRFLKGLLIVQKNQIVRVQNSPLEVYEVGESKRRVVYNPGTGELKCSCPDPARTGICKHRYAFYIYNHTCPRANLPHAYEGWLQSNIEDGLEELIAAVDQYKAKSKKQVPGQKKNISAKNTAGDLQAVF